jgi:hypothetical protein
MAFWSKAEDDFLRECALAKIPVDRMVPFLGRSTASIRMRRHHLGIPPPNGFQNRVIPARSNVSVCDMKRVVAEHFNIPVADMTSASRKREVTRPRQIAMFFAREVGHKSYPNIGLMFGGRDHSTVIHAVRTVERLIAEHDDFKDKVTTLRADLVSASDSTGVDKSHVASFVSVSAGA